MAHGECRAFALPRVRAFDGNFHISVSNFAEASGIKALRNRVKELI